MGEFKKRNSEPLVLYVKKPKKNPTAPIPDLQRRLCMYCKAEFRVPKTSLQEFHSDFCKQKFHNMSTKPEDKRFWDMQNKALFEECKFNKKKGK